MSRDGFLFGSDELGCDLLTRILLAARISLSTALIVVVCSVIIGVLLDVTADYYRGFFEDLIMRTVDLAMSFPSLLLAIVIIYIASPEVDMSMPLALPGAATGASFSVICCPTWSA